jgi:F-type H+-transporting ATPase subunit alpha
LLKQLQYSPMSVEKQVAVIYLGTQGIIKDVAVKNVKAFEEHFLLEMDNKLPEVLVEFKKGNLPQDGINKMVDLAKTLIPQYK